MKAKKLQKLKKNILFLLIAIGVIMVWRGTWGLFDLYLFPGQKLTSYLFSIFLGIGILLLDDGWLTELKH